MRPGNQSTSLVGEKILDDDFFLQRGAVDYHGLGDVLDARPNDLTYPIHPMLTKDKWQLPIRDGLEPILLPILRLASAILDSEASFRCWYTIINSKRNLDRDLTMKHRHFMSSIRTIDIYSLGHGYPNQDELREEFRKCVVYISLFLRIGLADPTDPKVTKPSTDPNKTPIKTINGYTQRAWNRKISFSTSYRPNIAGFGANVKLVPTQLLEIRNLEMLEPRTPHIINRILRLQFRAAATLCHELTHVVTTATQTEWFEPFYNDLSLNEMGLAYENDVYGGVSRLLCVGSHSLGHAKWPMSRDKPNESSLLIARRPPKGSSTLYVIPQYYNCKLGSQAFWDEWQNRRNEYFLHIPKVLGFRLYNDGTVDPTWRESQSSEGKYPADARQVVRRAPAVFPDPSDFVREWPPTDWEVIALEMRPAFWSNPLPPLPIASIQMPTQGKPYSSRIPQSGSPDPRETTIEPDDSASQQGYRSTRHQRSPSRRSPLPGELPRPDPLRRSTLGRAGLGTPRSHQGSNETLSSHSESRSRSFEAGSIPRMTLNRRRGSGNTQPIHGTDLSVPLGQQSSRAGHGAPSYQQTTGTLSPPQPSPLHDTQQLKDSMDMAALQEMIEKGELEVMVPLEDENKDKALVLENLIKDEDEVAEAVREVDQFKEDEDGDKEMEVDDLFEDDDNEDEEEKMRREGAEDEEMAQAYIPEDWELLDSPP